MAQSQVLPPEAHGIIMEVILVTITHTQDFVGGFAFFLKGRCINS